MHIKKLTISGVLLALCLVLPFLTGQIPQIGSALAPMHFPVLLCGFVCGGPWGLAVGFIAPLLRAALFGMPPLLPTGMAMAFELATYGLCTGLLYRRLPRRTSSIYVTLLLSMLAGRLVWGAAQYFLAGLAGSEFSMALFFAGAFTKAIPGILLQLVLIPILVLALQKGKWLPDV
ncbi:MAG: ECF transporter S component [Oscillospiraceae bacterium]